jgi:hypothetical protein
MMESGGTEERNLEKRKSSQMCDHIIPHSM